MQFNDVGAQLWPGTYFICECLMPKLGQQRVLVHTCPWVNPLSTHPVVAWSSDLGSRRWWILLSATLYIRTVLYFHHVKNDAEIINWVLQSQGSNRPNFPSWLLFSYFIWAITTLFLVDFLASGGCRLLLWLGSLPDGTPYTALLMEYKCKLHYCRWNLCTQARIVLAVFFARKGLLIGSYYTT